MAWNICYWEIIKRRLIYVAFKPTAKHIMMIDATLNHGVLNYKISKTIKLGKFRKEMLRKI